jgi:hypothetical protein
MALKLVERMVVMMAAYAVVLWVYLSVDLKVWLTVA